MWMLLAEIPMRLWTAIVCCIACAAVVLAAHPVQAACLQTLDRLPGQNTNPGVQVYVCQGTGVDYVKRTRRLVTWRSPNPGPQGAHEVRYLDVDRIIGHGVNWVSVTVVPRIRLGLQDPVTLNVEQAEGVLADVQPVKDPPDIPFPAGSRAAAHDRLHCAGIWRVPEGDVPAAMTMQLFADGRRQARFRGTVMRRGARSGLSFEFSDTMRIAMRGTTRLYPNGQGGWQVSCRFDVTEYDYYGDGRHRRSQFSGRWGELTRHD